MHRRFSSGVLFASLFVGLGLVSACSSSSSGEAAAGPKYPGVPDYCNARATAECSDALTQNCGASTQSCVVKRQQVCIEASTGTAQPGTYRADQAEACVAAVADAYVDGKVTAAERTATAAACGKLFDGSGVKGATCAVDGDCQVSQGLSCVLKSSAPAGDGGESGVTGSCQVPTSVGAGMSCSAADATCASGFYCDGSHCVQSGQVGDGCSQGTPCDEQFTCDPGTSKCTAKLLTGTACGQDVQCADGICYSAPGDPTGHCVSAITFGLGSPSCNDYK